MESISPQVVFSSGSVKLELPLPIKSERQKFILSQSDDLGYVCHNFVREKEIKDKLFSLQVKADSITELENKLLEKEKPTTLIEGNTWRDIAIGVSIGLISGFAISRKL